MTACPTCSGSGRVPFRFRTEAAVDVNPRDVVEGPDGWRQVVRKLVDGRVVRLVLDDDTVYACAYGDAVRVRVSLVAVP